MGAAPLDVQLGGPIIRTSSDIAPPDPTPQTGFIENLRATRQEMLLAGNTNAATENARSAYAPLVDLLEQVGARRGDGRHYLNPGDLPDEEQPTQYGAIPSAAQTKAEIFAEIRRRRLTDRNFAPGVPDTFEAFEEQTRQKNGERLRQIRGVQAGATRWGQVGGFLGGVIGSAEDPVNLWTMPFGGGARTVIGAAARSAAENMLVELVTQPYAMRNYRELGEDYTAGDAVASVLFAGGLGGAFGAGGHAIGALARNPEAASSRIFEAMPEPIRRRWADAATIDDRLLVDTLRAAAPEASWTSEQRSAIHVLERDLDVAESSPFERSPQGDDAHATGLNTALQSLIDRSHAPSSGKSALMNSTAIERAPGVVTAAPSHTSPGAPLSRDQIIHFTMHDLEGGAAVVPYSKADGGTTKFGIAAKFNPGVDVARLSDRQAADIYRERYWFSGLDQAPPATAAVAFDAGVISGPKVGQRILAASGGDAERAIALYRAHLNHIADTVPGKAKYRRGWNNRVDKLARKIGARGDGLAEAMPELASLGESRAVDAAEVDDLRAELAARDVAAAAGAERDVDVPFYEPVPILKRDLFPDDESWISAQLRIGEAFTDRNGPQSPGNGPPARETPSGPSEVAANEPAGAAGAVDAALPYRLSPARYAKGKMLLRSVDDGSGYKGAADKLAEALGGRWVNREKGYVMSPAAVAKLEQLHAAGFAADLRFYDGTAPTFHHPERGLRDLSVKEALDLARGRAGGSSARDLEPRKGMVKLNISGFGNVEVPATIVGDLAVHRGIGDADKPGATASWWTITHVPTGMSVTSAVPHHLAGDIFDTKRDTLAFAQEWVRRAIDAWEQLSEPLGPNSRHGLPETQPFRDAVRQAAHEIAAGIEPEVSFEAPALERFADPEGEGPKAQAESLEHDARMDVAAELATDQLQARNRQRPRQTGLTGEAARPIATFAQDPAQLRKKGQKKRTYYLPVTEHADHKAAKAGDIVAARRLVRDLVKPEDLERAATEIEPGAKFVPVIAEEASGRNAIPINLAEVYANATGGSVDTGIVQSVRAFHTGAGPAERVVRRAGFDGPVEKGARYVLVDDVAAMGGSIAELADHIQRGGGNVERVVLLASGVDDFAPTPKQIRAIHDGGYAEHFRTFAGIEPEALTRAEAEWALGRSPERVRDQLAEAMGRRDAGRDPAARRGGSAEQGGLEAPDRSSAAEDRTSYRLTEDGPEQTLEQILDEIDADEAAVEALRGCLKP